MKKYVIKLNDKVYEVEMEEVTSETSAAITESAKSAPKAASAPAAAPVSGGEKIEAPMPGTILSVSVKAGDTVKKNQVLVVLEAMKMENEIVSPVDGKVISVGVSKGDTVNPGDLLIQLG